MTVKISTYDVLRLQLESGCSPHTIYRYLSGVPVRPVSLESQLSDAWSRVYEAESVASNLYARIQDLTESLASLQELLK